MRENVGGVASVRCEGFAAHLLRSLRVIFRVADAAEDVARLQVVIVEIERAHGQLDGGELVVVVENGKSGRQAGSGGFAPQQPRAERMKRGKPGPLRRNASAQQKIGNTISHLLRGFVGEGDGENGFGRHAASNQVGHAEGDGARLAGAGSGQDQDRTFGGFRGETLFRIQRVEKVLHESGRRRIAYISC